MLNMILLSYFKFKVYISSKKKVPRVTVSRLESNMANDNVEGDMEVETTNPARSAYSNKINVIINGKTKQNMHIFLSMV